MNLMHANPVTSPALYLKKRAEIINIYNEHALLCSEEPTLDLSTIKKPTLLHVFYFDGIKGGVLVEQLMNYEKGAMITFAGIEDAITRNGVGTELVKLTSDYLIMQGIMVMGVQLNIGDKHEFWNKVGFTELIDFHEHKALIRPELE